MSLTVAERRILDAVTEALTGSPSATGSAAAVEPMISRLPSADRLQLRLLLRAVELGPIATRHLSRFSRLTALDRLEYLRGWGESRLALLRQGFAALRALAMIGHYGQPAGWADAGYRGPWLGRRPIPVLPAPPLAPDTDRPGARGIHSARRIGSDETLSAEVCVIGMGAGGAAALCRIAEAGIDVIGIDGGGSIGSVDFTQRELEMLPRLYRDGGLRATADKAIGILQGEGIGGSTLHNTGLVYEPPAAILARWRTEHGFEVGEAEIAGHVEGVLRMLRAVPIPDEAINPNNRALREGAESLGWRYRVALHNREVCSGCGYCMLGCAYNRKYNSSLTYIPRAIQAGARILSDASAVRIRGRSGARVVELHVKEGRGGPRRVSVRARAVVLAAGALDSPVLLLRSGLGGPQVGRRLRLHPAAAVAGSMPEPVIAWRGLPQSVIVEEFATFMTDGVGGYLFIPSAANVPGLAAVQIPGSGAEHRARMSELPQTAAALVLLHDETEGRVRATRDGRPVVRYWPSAPDAAEMRAGLGNLARLYLAAGARSVRLPQAGLRPVLGEGDVPTRLSELRIEPHRVILNSVHPQGSLAMGGDRAVSATDPRGELWAERGIFVADASLFPTSVGVPPQVTTMALAGVVADRVVHELR